MLQIICFIPAWSDIITTATGILMGYDQLLNLVLDGTIEHMQGRYIHFLVVACRYVYMYCMLFDTAQSRISHPS